MDAARVAGVLDEMGTLLELRGENPFRCRAYHNAAQAVLGVGPDLAEWLDDGRLAAVPGLGPAMLDKVAQLVTTGRLAEHETLREATPPGLAALLRVPGLGPKKIQILRTALNIAGPADLRAAAEAGKVAPIKGFGPKTQAIVLEGLAFLEAQGDRILQSTARRLAGPLLEALIAHPATIRAQVAGSLRRRAETIGDLDFVFASADVPAVLAGLATRPEVVKILGHGETKLSVRLAIGGVQCDFRGVADDQYAAALHYFTGSKEHNIALRRRAQARGLKLSEYGLEGDGGPVACPSEEALFAALGLAYIPPELREGVGPLAAAEAGPLPLLIERGDLSGTFHCHTDWSDGAETLEGMAEAARSRGLAYLGIADHSRTAAYAGGLSVERLAQQWEAIDALNARLGPGFRLYKGTECDILADGTLDFPDEVLAGCDYVVASVHSHFRQGREAMTRRLVAAVSNPRVTMLGHPTGRLLLTREGYDFDLEAILVAAAAAGTAIEINANPHRLDLEPSACRRAKALGIPIAINPDAHAAGGIDDLDYGIGVARRAALGPSDVLNAGPPDEVRGRLERMRARV